MSELDFDVNEYNTGKDTRKVSGSGITAGIEGGVSEVSTIPRGVAPQEMQGVGTGRTRPQSTAEAASKDGMKFTIGVG